MPLWDGRFSEERKNSLIDFSESISFDHRLYRQDIEGSRAHVKMLALSEIISQDTADAICGELESIQRRIDAGDFKFSHELEDIHMHIESALIKALGDEGARVHTARSRNDQVALDVRLYLRNCSTCLSAGMRSIQTALVEKAETESETIMPGFTHLQHAQPVLFAHHLLAYVEMLERDLGRLSDCIARISECPLGSGAIAGTTLPINRHLSAELLNFTAGPSNNSMDSVSDRDFVCEFISCLAIFAMHMSRLSEDIILWSSQEFSFIELGDAYCTGSSLMPQKKNPDLAELTRGKTGRIYGSLISVLTTCKGLPMSYNRDLQEDKEALFDAIDTVRKICSVYPGMISSIKVNSERMLHAASDPFLMATDLAELLVRKGVPFREAHSRVGKLVRHCRENSVSPEKVGLDAMKAIIPEADEDCLSLFCPKKSIAARELIGGTGFKEVSKQIRRWKNILLKKKQANMLSDAKCKRMSAPAN